jgi:metal-sulfur cluster biosynthetic enzyme
VAQTRADEPGLCPDPATRLSDHTAEARGMSRGLPTSSEQVQARIWEALRHVDDPEIPVSVLGMGLIVSVGYEARERRADLQITFTAMGCPATEFIEEDIREALLSDPDIDAVAIEVVWDPVWTKDRVRTDARATMRRLGILV